MYEVAKSTVEVGLISIHRDFYFKKDKKILRVI